MKITYKVLADAKACADGKAAFLNTMHARQIRLLTDAERVQLADVTHESTDAIYSDPEKFRHGYEWNDTEKRRLYREDCGFLYWLERKGVVPYIEVIGIADMRRRR